VKTPEFKSYQQAFSPSTADPTDFAEPEAEYTLPVSTGLPVSISRFPGRNTRLKIGSNAAQPGCKRNNSVIPSIQVVRFEKQKFWKT